MEPAESDDFIVTGPFAAQVPLDGSNLVVRARDAFRSHLAGGRDGAAEPGSAAFPVAIHLEKNLPVASGIGGGSSDAAAALKALSALWRPRPAEALLARVGLGLGADVPMCLAATPLLAAGIGETLASVAGFPQLFLVLVNPGRSVSTADVFRALESRDNPGLQPLSTPLDAGSLLGWLGAQRNDLQATAVALAPEIGEALEALSRQDAAFARMSGSGATCFGIFPLADEAEAAAKNIAAAHPAWFVTATSTAP